MAREYSYKMEHLEELHGSMRALGVFVHVFDFEFNKVDCKAMFQADTAPFLLTFFKKVTGEVLSLPVRAGYRIIVTDGVAASIHDYFEVRGCGGHWPHKQFMTYLKTAIPTKAKARLTSSERRVVARACRLEETESIYFLGLINWEERNAKQPDASLHKHRSQDNLEKTRRLYPEIYHAVKNRDISVCYTDDEEKARRRWKGNQARRSSEL